MKKSATKPAIPEWIRDCREHLGAYYLAINPGWTYVAYQQEIIIPAVEALERGDFDRLMIFISPGHAKTEIATKALVPWYFGKPRNYRKNVILVTRAADLCLAFGGHIRDVMQGKTYKTVYPDVRILQSTRAKHYFKTTQSQEFMAFGTDGGITGNRADFIIMEDWIGNLQEAQSEDIQKHLYEDIYKAVIRDRLRPKGRMLFIMCFAEGTKVLTVHRGWQPIQNLEVGEDVWRVSKWSQGGACRIAQGKITAKIYQGVQPTVAVDLGTRKLRVTANHPVLRHWPKLGWVEAGKVAEGDRLYALHSLPSLHPEMSFANPTPPWPVDIELYPEFFWMLGYLYGDGFLTNTPECKRLRVARGLDEPDLMECADLLGVYCNHPVLWRGDAKSPCLHVNNAKIVEVLNAWGMNTAKEKRLPEWLYARTREEKREFLRGLCDADGYWRRSDYAVLKLANRALLEDCRLLAWTCGISCGNVNEETYESPLPQGNTIQAIRWCLALGFKERGSLAFSQWRSLAVRSVGNELDLPVWDIEVDGGEGNVIADGLVAHNTRWGTRDVAARILDDEAERWKVLVIPAQEHAEGCPDDDTCQCPYLWESHFGRPFYDEFKQDRQLWQAKWQQSPRPILNQGFQEEWLRFWLPAGAKPMYRDDPNGGPPMLVGLPTDYRKLFKFNAYIFVDPAMGKEAAHDRTSIWVIVAGPEGRLFVVDGILDRLDPGERIQGLLRLCRKWRPKAIYYEEYALTADTYFLTRALEQEGLASLPGMDGGVTVTSVGRKAQHFSGGRLKKHDRIMQLVPDFRDGRIWLPVKLECQLLDGSKIDIISYFINREYLPYAGEDSIAHDDCLDCLSRVRDPDVFFDHLQRDDEDDEEYGEGGDSGGSWESRY